MEIFVGGLGRSGTTILTEMLGRHPDVYALPWETRFIVDPDGLGEVVEALSNAWCGPSVAGVKLQRFRTMMLRDLVNRESEPYRDYDLYEYFDPRSYAQAIDRFFESTIDCEFAAHGLATHRTLGRPVSAHDGFTEVVTFGYNTRVIPRYMTPDEARQAAATLVDDLFGAAARERGCAHWCEKTPHNILSPYPRRLFPEAKVIHILRDVRDVVASIGSGEHEWGPAAMRDALSWAYQFHRCWRDKRIEFSDDPNYLELRFEQLVADPESVMRRVCEFLAVDYATEMCNIDLSHHNIGRYRRGLVGKDRNWYNDHLAPLTGDPCL